MFGLAKSDVKEPLLQCLHIKPMQVGGNLDRWRIVLSDGEFFVQSMLGAANKQLVMDGLIKRNTIVKLKGYNANFVNQKRYVPLRHVRIPELTDAESSSCWTSRCCRSTASPRESATR
jgi:hypothetical protein